MVANINGNSVEKLQISFQDVVFLPSRASFPPHFLEIVVDVKALGPPHVVITWLVSKGMLTVKYLSHAKPLFVSVEFHGDHKAVTKMRYFWPPSLLEIMPDVRPW